MVEGPPDLSWWVGELDVGNEAAAVADFLWASRRAMASSRFSPASAVAGFGFVSGFDRGSAAADVEGWSDCCSSTVPSRA